MIIWSRWGFLSFLGIGLGVGLAFVMVHLVPSESVDDGPVLGATVLTCAAGVNALLAYLVYPRLDRPRPVTFTRPLAQPVRHPNGSLQTHEVVAAQDPEGRPIWERPRSTLFFIPARLIWVVLLVLAAVVGLISLFSG